VLGIKFHFSNKHEMSRKPQEMGACLVRKRVAVKEFDIHGSVHCRYISKCNQQDAALHNLFISVKCSIHVSGGTSAHHQELKTVYTASGTRQTKFFSMCFIVPVCCVCFAMYGPMNVKLINVKQAQETYQYRNIKRKLCKANAAVW
jgi:hypothetical protein